MNYPICERRDYTETYFGRELPDPYHWLHDAKAAETLEWVRQENAFTDQWFDAAELKAKIDELKGKQLEELPSKITPWKDHYVLFRTQEGEPMLVLADKDLKEQKILYRRGCFEHFSPFGLDPCPAEPDIIALTGLFDGYAKPSVMVIDTRTDQVLLQINDLFSYVWSKTKPVIYLAESVAVPEEGRTDSRVIAYTVGGGQKEIYKDELTSVFGILSASPDKKHIIINMMEDYSRGRFYLYNEETGAMTDVTEGKGCEMYYGGAFDGLQYFVSKEQADRGEVIAIADGGTLNDAKVIRPEDKEVFVSPMGSPEESAFGLKGRQYFLVMEDVNVRLLCREGEKESFVPLPGEIGNLVVLGAAEEGVFFKYESFIDKPMLLFFDGEEMRVIKKTSEESHPDLITELRFAPSTGDGKDIPYFMTYHKNTVPNMKNPVWITAYGGYNVNLLPTSTEMVTGLDIAEWAEQGGVFVQAILRGGAEYGTPWHEEGMLLNKKNCYYDFIGVTEKLIADGWTKSSRIIISGCSNGGLLMSALVTMRPDLFGCVIDSVPHTDMIHFVSDDRGPMYIMEYGDPLQDEEHFDYFLSYSPYHNVREEQYPPVYIQTGEFDNNVPPYHGKKFAAKMQAMNKSGAPILLRVLAEGSHDRGSGEVYWKTIAEMQLFAEKALAKAKADDAIAVEAYYEAHPEMIRNVIRTQHILVETKEEAEKLLAEIKDGADFAKLAEAYSLCPSGKESGGDLGFYPNGLFVEPYETAAQGLAEPGDICGPVQSQFGYHIIKLLEKKAVLPLEECREILKMQMELEKRGQK